MIPAYLVHDGCPDVRLDPLGYWTWMVRASSAGITDEQAVEVAKIALRDGCGTWHAAHVYFATKRCWCARCEKAPVRP